MAFFDRVGTFAVSKEIIEKNPMAMMDVFQHFIILAARYDKEKKLFVYSAASHLFDEIREGEEVPGYRINLSQSDVGKLVAISAERMKEENANKEKKKGKKKSPSKTKKKESKK